MLAEANALSMWWPVAHSSAGRQGLRCRMSMSCGRQARVRARVFQNDGVLWDTELESSATGWYLHTHTHTHTSRARKARMLL